MVDTLCKHRHEEAVVKKGWDKMRQGKESGGTQNSWRKTMYNEIRGAGLPQ